MDVSILFAYLRHAMFTCVPVLFATYRPCLRPPAEASSLQVSMATLTAQNVVATPALLTGSLIPLHLPRSDGGLPATWVLLAGVFQHSAG